MPTPLVTICIPAHNAEATLARALDSALAQTWPRCEVIAVDDGSTDGTGKILRRYADQVHVITQPPRGGNAARNAAAGLAEGEWLQFLDADDELLPEKIECQIAETGDALAVAGLLVAPVLVEENGRRSATELDPERDLFESWLSWELPQTGAALWRRETLRDLGGWKESMPCCQEHELYLRALMAGVPVTFTRTAGAVYHIWSQETVCRRDPVQVVEVRTALLDHAAAYLQRRGRWTEAHRRTMGRACFEMARTLAALDRNRACAYHAERQARRGVEPTGPAAPMLYQLIYRTLGFRTAEAVAALRRG